MHHWNKGLFIALAMTGTIAVAATAEPLTLVKDHKPNATIVLQEKAPAPMRAAAVDLQKYLQKITGVELPLHTDGVDVPGITLNIGKTATSQASDLPDPALNPETCAITQRGDDLYFAAHYPSPTAFAVYSFMQDQLGVRWFAPGDDWEHVPNHKDQPDFTVTVENELSVPGTSPRIWSGHSWTPDWSDWNRRNKAVLSEKVLRRNFQNNIHRIFPPSKYAKSNPEYYPLINGKRWIPPSDSYVYWWPPMGEPSVQQATIEYIRKWFDEHPDQDSFSLGMDDIAYMSDDPLSNAMDSSPDDYKNKKFSSRFYKFVNIIAKEIKKTHPDRYIGTLIYNIAVEPPADVPQMEDNVFGFIANGSAAQWYQGDKKERWMENTKEWRKRVKHLSRYDYFGMGTYVPRIFPHAMAEMMEIDQSLGFEGCYIEMYTFLPQTAPMIWAFAQKQWTPSLKIDDLLKEFYTKMYGKAAPSMEAYFTLMEDSWNTERPGHVGWVHRNIVHQAASISPEAVDEGMDLLNRAHQEATEDVEKRRIDVTRGALQFGGYVVKEFALAQQISSTAVQDADSAQKVLELVTQFGQQIKGREGYWPEAMERQDLLGANLRAFSSRTISGRTSYLQSDTSQLDYPAIPGILRLIAWYGENQPDKLASVSKQITSNFPSGSILDAIHSWSWVQENKPKSLLLNGDFVKEGQDNPAAEGADWSGKNAPSNWSTWSSQGNVKFFNAAGRSGAGIRIQSDVSGGDNGVAMQRVKLDPSKKYIGVVWMKSTKADDATNATLSFRFSDKNGWYTGEGERVSSNGTPGGGWQQIIVSSTVPEGATNLTFMLGSNHGDAIFDEAVLYEVP